MDFRTESGHIRTELQRVERNIGMETVSVEELSQEIVTLAETIKRFGQYLSDKKEEIRAREQHEDRRDTLQDRVNYNYYHDEQVFFESWLADLNTALEERKAKETKKKTPKKKNPTPKKKDPTPTEVDDIEKKINRFLSQCDNIKKQLNEILAKLVLDSTYDLTINEFVIGLDAEVKALDKESRELIAAVDAFKEEFEQNPSMTYEQIVARVADLKTILKRIKQTQQTKYNARVDEINARIAAAKGIDLSTVSPEVAEMIAKLTPIDRSTGTILWNTTKTYLPEIDYNKLLEMNRLLYEIEGGKVPPVVPVDPTKEQNTEVELEIAIKFIENETARIEKEIVDDMKQEDIDRLIGQIQVVYNAVADFRVNLENNKDKLSQQKYSDYLDRVTAAETKLQELEKKLNQKKEEQKVQEQKSNDYKELMNILNALEVRVVDTDVLISALSGNVWSDAQKAFSDHLELYSNNLEDIRKAVEEKHKAGTLDDVQYGELNKKMDEISELIKKSKEKIANPDMYKDVDVYHFIGDQIIDINNAISVLDSDVVSAKEPIKKAERRAFEARINEIAGKISVLREYLELHANDNPEKYETMKEELDKSEQRLQETIAKYNKKCPFMVKAWKSTKEFYKKHKKAILTLGALGAVACFTPMIIPALMHGNVMLGAAVPALSGKTFALNKILGSIAGATFKKGAWFLSSGAIINPGTAAISLAKALASIGGGIGIFGVEVAAVVAAIKAWATKAEKTQKVAEQKEKEEKKEKYEGKYTKKKKTLKEKLKEYRDQLKAHDVEMGEEAEMDASAGRGGR